ncbi:GPP34 family phosphoprotein [Kitasatospora sp. NPDC048540]|uniref:GOLPH3/VPS74 family protein n=1 Tax=unclassified Kitasatospora TaxID=2633591 RepID=UPI00053B7184|nr:GPP34 family phosphoprotein [Kitasatospora sp. MBT63]
MTRPLHLATYLMAFDTDRQTLFDRTRTGFLVRAAVLAELARRGSVADDGGTVAVAEAEPTGDPVLDAALTEVGAHARRWKAWIRRDREDTLEAVEQQLAVLGAVLIEDRDPYGPPARRRVLVPDPAEALAVQRATAALLRGEGDPARVGLGEAALAALAAAGGVGLVVSRGERRAHRDRVTALTGRLSELSPALARAVGGLGTTLVAAQGGMGGG